MPRHHDPLFEPLPPAGEWLAMASCRGMDPQVFFPRNDVEALAAKQVCNACPVSAQCLAYALDNGIPDGVWGGRDEKERQPAGSRRRSKAASVALPVVDNRPRCPFCSSTWVTPSGSGHVTCLDCQARWPREIT